MAAHEPVEAKLARVERRLAGDREAIRARMAADPALLALADELKARFGARLVHFADNHGSVGQPIPSVPWTDYRPRRERIDDEAIADRPKPRRKKARRGR